MKLLFILFLSLSVLAGVDGHVHLFSFNHEANLEYIKKAQDNNIKMSFIHSFSYGAKVRSTINKEEISEKDFIQRENDYLLNLQKEFPKNILAFCSVPWMYEETEKEISRCAKNGAKGLKVYPSNFYIKEDGNYGSTYAHFSYFKKDLDYLNKLIKLAVKYDLIFGIHSSSMDSSALTTFLYQSAYRHNHQMKLIFLHGFTGQPLELLNTLGNHLSFFKDAKIMIEMSSFARILGKQSPMRELFIKCLKYIGIDNILFGSDEAVFTDKDLGKTQAYYLKAYSEIFNKDEMQSILKISPRKVLDQRFF